MERFRWRDPQLDPRQPRPDAPFGLFIAEGDLVVERALDAGFLPAAVLADTRRRPAVLERFAAEVPVFLADAGITKALTGFGVVLDIVALFHRRPPRSLASVLEPARRLVVFEEIDNPANLGAMVRSAAALGFEGVVFDPSSADPLARRSARASMGAVFSMPWARTGSIPGGLDPLRAAGFRLLALTPSPGAPDLGSLRIDRDQRVALLLGSERSGLSDAALGAAEPIRIPMAAGVDSLNVAAAAAIACYVLGG